jgi:lactoylglutathione lyase
MPETDVRSPIPWPIKGAITFFYYEDLRRAIGFYEHTIGLKKLTDLDWCAVLEIVPGAHLGLVKAPAGIQRPIAGANKGVLIAFETDDLHGCLERMRHIGVASAQTRVAYNSRTHDFKVLDPEGYTIEFFTWSEQLGNPRQD